jgi:hypothetical protein
MANFRDRKAHSDLVEKPEDLDIHIRIILK